MPLDPLRAVGAVQVGAAVGAEVVAGLYVDHHMSAHGTLLSLACRHPPNAREPPHITHSGRTVPVAAAIRPTRTPAPGSPSVCLDRRRALPPRLRGAAELKFLPTKRTFHPIVPRLKKISCQSRFQDPLVCTCKILIVECRSIVKKGSVCRPGASLQSLRS